MSILKCGEKLITVDENGFLTDHQDWDEEVASALASQEGFDSLSTEQMDLVRFMREYFLKYTVFPLLDTICRMVPPPELCVNEQSMHPEKVWKIAGLPKQDGVRFVSLDGGRHYTLEPYR